MKNKSIDLLMITFNRDRYTMRSLKRLLDTCDETMRVWIWQNGAHKPTLEVVKSLENHPRVHRVKYSEENIGQREPTRWLWENSDGAYLSKIDDDILLSDGWAQTLRKAHEDVPEFGVIGCWHFIEEDFDPELASKKIQSFPGGHQLMVNCWLGGTGYLLKKSWVDKHGFWRPDENFSDYGIRLALNGAINGWYYPFIYQDHMDDPRSEFTELKTEEDFQRNLPVSAQTFGIKTLEDWKKRMAVSARQLQASSIDPRDHLGWKRKIKWWLGLY